MDLKSLFDRYNAAFLRVRTERKVNFELKPHRVHIGLALPRGSVVSELPVVMVVEDEYDLQAIVEEALTEAGFETDILSSGEEALTLFRGGLKNYKALVTDVGLKGRLNGWEVAAQIREADPGFPIVYMSGAHADEWASKGVPNSIMLTKPFAPAQLVTAISQLLNSVLPTNP